MSYKKDLRRSERIFMLLFNDKEAEECRDVLLSVTDWFCNSCDNGLLIPAQSTGGTDTCM